ncbi:MAG: Mur ligase domain-containing protein, partial [Pseudomonadota bacterium]
MQLPFEIKRIHLLGIGGIGMSGLAEILHGQGFKVSGSDRVENFNIERLRKFSIPVQIGHDEDESEGASVVVVSSAIQKDNVALKGAFKHKIPVIKRAEMLAELMRLKWPICVGGTHGKTTTTSLIGHLFDVAGMDPSVINGGVINAYGSNARLGQSHWLVAEADESDGTFVHLPAMIGVITNIDREHMENYRDFDDVRAAYKHFLNNIPFYGFSVLCIDHRE